MSKPEVRSEFIGKRPHGFVLCASSDAQGTISLRACLVDQLAEQGGANAPPAQAPLDAEGNLRLGARGLIGRMQLRSTSNLPVFEIRNHDGPVARALRRIALDEAVMHKAVEPIVAALGIKPQQMITQLGQFFISGKRANRASCNRGTENVSIAHVETPLGSPRGGVESLEWISCAAQHEIQGSSCPEMSGFYTILLICDLYRGYRTICV